jgi:hypothetical protein
MRFRNLIMLAAATLLAVLPAAADEEVVGVINFEGPPAGTIVYETVADYGGGTIGPIDVFGDNPALSGLNAAVIFDSDMPTGGDDDLGTPNETCPGGGPGMGSGGEVGMPYENCVPLHNVLIIAENLDDADSDGLVDDPDDSDVPGQVYMFDFRNIVDPFVPDDVTVFEVTILDVEEIETPGDVTLYAADDTVLGAFSVPAVGDNGVTTIETGPTDVGTSGVAYLVVDLQGSGGIDNIVMAIRTEPTCGDETVDPGETCDPPGSTPDTEYPDNLCRDDCTYCGDGELNGDEECDFNDPAAPETCTTACVIEQMGGQGCTPGYWKQRHHFGSWTLYSPGDDYGDVFGVDPTFDAETLLEVLRQGGGGEIALGRHAVAALLNSTNPDVDYAYSTAQVISIVQDAYATGEFNAAKNMLAYENETWCPLGRAELSTPDRSADLAGEGTRSRRGGMLPQR